MQTNQIKELKVSSIVLGENSRIAQTQADLTDLMQSIKKEGLLQPIGVRKKGKYYEVMFGNRRFEAVKKLGWATIPATIFDVKSDSEFLIKNLTENFKRKSTTAYEEARAYRTLMGYGLTQSEIGARLGVNQKRIDYALSAETIFTPADMKSIVTGTNSPGRGKVAGAVAKKIATMRTSSAKTNNVITKNTAKKLLDMAKEGKVNLENLNSVSSMLEAGYDLSKALKATSNIEMVTVRFFMPTKTAKALEKKHSLLIEDYIVKLLMRKKELKVKPRDLTAKRLSGEGKPYTRARI